VTQITTDASREFARDRLDKVLSNDSVNGSMRLLRRMLNIAHEDQKIQVVPKIRLLKSSPRTQGFSRQRAVRLPRLVSYRQSQTPGDLPVLLRGPSR